jgi:hypothetical protein
MAGQSARQASARPRGMPPVLRKITLTVVSGGLSLAAALLLQRGGGFVQALMISVLISGVALVVDFLHEFEQRLAELDRSTRDELAQTAVLFERGHADLRLDMGVRFTQLTTVPEAFGLQPLDNNRAAQLVQVVQNAYAFEHECSPLARSFIERRAERFALLLHQLKSGEGTYDGEDRDWLLTLAETCGRSIDATSSTSTDAGGRLRYGGGFWESDLGMRYLEQQRRAVRRGVKVRRVFILEDAKVTDDPFYIKLCARQQRIGIDVRYLTPDMVTPELSNKLDDFILFDNEISYEVVPSLTPGELRPAISKTHLVLDRELVATRLRQFSDLWDSALPCPDEFPDAGNADSAAG